jgi:hypothetical protein
MDNNEVILQPEIAGNVDAKIGKVTKMNFLCPEDDPTTTGDGKIDSPFNDFIQNLKCCGNCSHYSCGDLDDMVNTGYTYCTIKKERGLYPSWVCDNWSWDGVTYKRRLPGE